MSCWLVGLPQQRDGVSDSARRLLDTTLRGYSASFWGIWRCQSRVVFDFLGALCVALLFFGAGDGWEG